MPNLVLRFDRDEIDKVFQYGCMVEMWDHVVGRGSSGSKRRKYHAAFNEKERAYISKWHTRFFKWYSSTGVPRHIAFRHLRNVDLLRRAIHFFATV